RPPRLCGRAPDEREHQGAHRERRRPVKALVLHAPGDARIEESPYTRTHRTDEVTLRVLRAGLCGTDATEYSAGPVLTPLLKRHPASGVQGPVVLGHEHIASGEEY